VLVGDARQVEHHIDTPQQLRVGISVSQVHSAGGNTGGEACPRPTERNDRIAPGSELLAKLTADKSGGAAD
jgi:hypothetical protein